MKSLLPYMTLYTRSGLWALGLPCRLYTRRCAILRHLIMQLMLKHINSFYQVFLSNRQTSTSDLPEKPKQKEGQAFFEQLGLLSILPLLKPCKPVSSFFQCYVFVINSLFNHNILNIEEKDILLEWIRNLKHIESITQFPKLVESKKNLARKEKDVYLVLNDHLSTSKKDIIDQHIINPVKERCQTSRNGKDFAMPFSKWQQPPLKDIVLIIEFNEIKHLFPNIPFLEAVHRPMFHHIFYCVPDIDEVFIQARRKQGKLLLPNHKKC